MNEPLITAVICTRNRAPFLRKCITSLLNQTASPDLYEILIVDNGSTDSTGKVVLEFQDNDRIRSFYEPVAGLSRARNVGWLNARGTYVGYIDDDAVAAETWIAAAAEAFNTLSPQPSWLGGPIDLEWEVPGPAWIDLELKVPLGYIDWGSSPRRLSPEERLGGGNSIYPRKVLQALGGFDERLGRGENNLLSGEETQFQRKVEQAGGFLYYHPDLKIFHWVGVERMRPQWFYRRYYWGGITDYCMAKSLAGQLCSEGAVSSEKVTRTGGKRWKRLVANLIRSIGIIGPSEKTIRARIYLCYVIGYLAATWKWNARKRAENS